MNFTYPKFNGITGCRVATGLTAGRLSRARGTSNPKSAIAEPRAGQPPVLRGGLNAARSRTNLQASPGSDTDVW